MTELNASIRHQGLPIRMRHLPISDEGFPVPWFVAFVDGKADFRCIGPGKLHKAIRLQLCWLCGYPLGRFVSFVIGPMCAINRTSAEPPCHRECAEYAVRTCPFLTRPRMRRNEKDLPEHQLPPGEMITRNPGVALIWTTRGYTVRQVDNGVLFYLGAAPTSLQWFANGKHATRAEVQHSIATGLPLLQRMAQEESAEAVRELQVQVGRAMQLLPA